METGYSWSSESFTPGVSAPFSDRLFSEPVSRHPEVDLKYEFAHDKVQEACYDMIPSEQLAAVHLAVGRNLKQNLGKTDDVLFEVCNHLMAGKSFLQDNELREMATLNLHAGRTAMTQGAFDHALRYSLAARAISKTLTEEIDENFGLSVGQLLVQSLFSLARYDEALIETDAVLSSKSGDSAIVTMGVEKVRVLRSLGRNREAYEEGMRTIQWAGLEVPENIWDATQIVALTASYKAGLDTEDTVQVNLFQKSAKLRSSRHYPIYRMNEFAHCSN